VKKTFPIEIDQELHKRLKISAIEEGLTLQDWIIRTLREKVSRNGTDAKQPEKGEGATERRRSR